MSRSSFQLFIKVRNAETGACIVFKQDGQRFTTSSRTFKFCTDTNYKWTLKCKPDYKLKNFQFGEHNLILTNTSIDTGEYIAMWNTAGIKPTCKSVRNDYTFILSCFDGTLQKKIQTKFYSQNHPHAEWGQKFDSFIWTCEIDKPSNTINIIEEQVI